MNLPTSHGAPSLEPASCPLGCPPGEDAVLVGRDRLHGLPGSFTVVRCRTCGLMRTSPRPSPTEIHRFYPSDYQPHLDTRVTAPRARPPSSPPAKVRSRKRRRLDALNHAIPPLAPARMLEIGCGSGSFLREMAEQGWSVRGVESSEAAGQAARAAGLPVAIGSLESVDDLGGPYELIVAWMALEHLHEPIAALRKLCAVAAPSAWLCLSVPDAGSWEFRYFGESWYALQVPTHLFHYTPRTLASVLAAGGWQVERVLWQRDAKNLLHSLRYRCLDRGWTRPARALEEMIAGTRARGFVKRLRRTLGLLHQSGRITVWARRSADQAT
jgi:2-polyprenyl-3-methyl-5-hydroxy-6-metoxy-1,4-benzoquinol methylase